MNSREAETYPLAPTQQGMLVSSLRNRRGLVDIVQIVVRFDEKLDVDRLSGAWRWAVDRHAVLRTAFRWDAEPVQCVAREAELPIAVVEVSDPSRLESKLGAFLPTDRELGFDLATCPLARVTIFVSPRRAVMVWTLHHAILDGRSFTRVLAEVLRRYDARRSYDPPAPPPFREHCLHLARRDVQRERAYWTNELAGLVPARRLPGEPPARRSKSAGHHGEIEIRIEKKVLEKVLAAGREHDFTLANAMQGAWAIVLSRYARSEDVCFGVTRSGRYSSTPDATEMIGCLINTTPLRVTIEPELGLGPWLGRLRKRYVSAREFEQTPLTSMRGWANVRRPLFESLVVFERKTLDAELRSPTRSFSVLQESEFPLVLAGYGEGDELVVALEHDRDRCDPRAAARLLDHFRAVFEAIGEPGVRVGDVRLIGESERQALLRAAGGDGALAPAAQRSWPEAWRVRVELTPDATALVHADGELTFAELDRLATDAAAQIAETGAKPGDVIAVSMRRSPRLAASLVAILRSGMTYLPIDPDYPREHQRALVLDSKAKLVIADEPIELDPARVIVLDAGERPHTPAAIETESPAYLIYTSGSTGKPKGVLVPHRALFAHARAIVSAFELTPNDRAYQFTSPSFDVSLEEMLPTWLAGAAVVLRSEAAATSIVELFRELERQRVTVVNLPSAYFAEVAEHVRAYGAAMPERVRLVVVGGETVKPAAYAAWRNAHPRVRFLDAYGPTEVTVTSTYCDPIESGIPADGSTPLPIGRPLGTCRAYVLDRNGDLAPIGVPGELALSGPQVALGYLGRTDARFTAGPFAPGQPMFKTGDLVERLPNGDLAFLGRLDEQVKIRGYRIEPGEVETVLRSLAGVKDAVVAARADGSGGLRLVAWVVLDGERDLDALRADASTRLPGHMLPAAIAAVDSFPIGATGKVDKSRLPEPNAASEVDRFVAPANDLETWIASLFAELLGQSRVGAEDNFFDLGGHSLLAMRLLAQLNARARRPLDLPTLFAQPTVRELAKAMESVRRPELPTLVALNRGDPRRPPFFCVCGVQLYADLARALEPDRSVYGAFLSLETDALTRKRRSSLDVVEMAREYVELVRTEQPHGPYSLGGVSFGGILAYEMARQLRASGQNVALLALFDAILPRAILKASPMERVRLHARRLAGDPRAYAGHIRRRARQHLSRWTNRPPGTRDSQQVDLHDFRDALFYAALVEYDRTIRPYEGRVVLFRATDPRGYEGERVAPDLGWSGLIPSTTAIHDVEGTHLGILNQPGVQAIADVLRLEGEEIDPKRERVGDSVTP
jgi:amino acid adenylation domain-containing protein